MMHVEADVTESSDNRSRGELERLLKLAESIHERIIYLETRLRSVRLLEFALLCGFGAAVVSTLGSRQFPDWNYLLQSPLRTVLLIVPLMVLIAMQSLVATMRRASRPERRALSEVVALLREASDGIAYSENWSVLERAEFRIRLSRFDMSLEEEGFQWFDFPLKAFGLR
jgi:hypothetical protein